MLATKFEYKYRFILHALIYTLGFWAPWVNLRDLFGWTDKSTWIYLTTLLSQAGIDPGVTDLIGLPGLVSG